MIAFVVTVDLEHAGEATTSRTKVTHSFLIFGEQKEWGRARIRIVTDSARGFLIYRTALTPIGEWRFV
jgi:hypothetical protein